MSIQLQSGQPRDKQGQFAAKDEPLVQFTITNPVSRFKAWFSKILANEGVDIRLRIHPLTAIALASAVALGSFSLGRISIPTSNPIVKYLPQLQAQPSPSGTIWKETAYSGWLRYSTINKKFYLDTTAAEAVSLEVPASINLTKYIGKRIFATGKFNTQTGSLLVAEATNLEILPNTITYIPQTTPVPSASILPYSASPTPLPTIFPSIIPTPAPTPSNEP